MAGRGASPLSRGTSLLGCLLLVAALSAWLGTPSAAASQVPQAAPRLTSREMVTLGTTLDAGAQTARIVGWTAVQNRPGPAGKVWTGVGALTSWSHEPQTLLVIGTATVRGRAWVRVLLGIRPDGSNGWIPRNRVVLGTDPYWIQVSKSARTVTVYRDGIEQLHVRAVIGASVTPTPDGIAAVWESDRQPSANDFLGAWAMPLTLLSNVLENFGGGPGRIAIHGRGGASLVNPLGSAASHGCIRVDNSAILWMSRRIHQGTPVDVVG
jgi:lipoprotein-anchoring transpeptidase ErfK/SrfK